MRARPLAVRIALGTLVLVAALAGLRELARSRTVQLFGRLAPRVETAERVVALTFDDGPVAARVDALLSDLASRQVRATFFVTGAELARAPEAGRKLVAAGHELGNHSYQHKHMLLHGPGFFRDEVERTDALIRSVGGQGEIYFRPPFGYKLIGLPWYLSRTGRTSVTWDVEPDSYRKVAASAEGIVQHVKERARPGSIILLHPWYASRETSRAAVPGIIDALHAGGFRFVTVGELLRAQASP
jgi:peptidoglycan/xylan/chitin deacetylase (PgdA/CDA1 family)